MPKETKDMTKLIESLSPNERKIIPFLNEKNLDNLREKTNLESTAIVRALEFLSNKDLIKTSSTSEKIIEPEINGLLYLNQGLPERRLINILVDKKSLSIGDAKKESKLNDNEFKVALGVLKKKNMI